MINVYLLRNLEDLRLNTASLKPSDQRKNVSVVNLRETVYVGWD